MTCRVVHALPGRVRVRVRPASAVSSLGPGLERLRGAAGVDSVECNPRTGSVLVLHDPGALSGQTVLDVLSAATSGVASGAVDGEYVPPSDATACAVSCGPAPTTGGAGEALGKDSGPSLAGLLLPLALRPVLPGGFQLALALRGALPRLWKGVVSLCSLKLSVDVLDAAALGFCILRRDVRSLGTITLLLGAGEFLESWTR